MPGHPISSLKTNTLISRDPLSPPLHSSSPDFISINRHLCHLAATLPPTHRVHHLRVCLVTHWLVTGHNSRSLQSSPLLFVFVITSNQAKGPTELLSGREKNDLLGNLKETEAKQGRVTRVMHLNMVYMLVLEFLEYLLVV